MYFTSCIGDAIRIPLRLTLFVVSLVLDGTEHVEQKRRALRGNKISCRRRSMVGAKAAPPPHISDCNREEDICSEGDSEGEDNSYLPPKVFALTWHADVGYIMHMVSCIAYFIHQICHLLSLDILCMNAIFLVYSSFMSIMQRHLV